MLYPIVPTGIDDEMAFASIYIFPEFIDPVSRGRKTSWTYNLHPPSRQLSGHLPPLAWLMALFMEMRVSFFQITPCLICTGDTVKHVKQHSFV